MRAAIALVVFASSTVLLACSPDISTGAYYCGPERLCPPDLACDEPTFICVVSNSAQPFTCPAGADANEPDDDVDTAADLGTLRCGAPAPLTNFNGCLDSASDTDLYKFEYDDECSGSDPQVRVRLSHPIAFASVTFEMLDSEGAVIQTSELCTPSNDFTGSELQCMDARLTSGTYYLRIKTPSDTVNCDGDCHYNEFTLSVNLPLS